MRTHFCPQQPYHLSKDQLLRLSASDCAVWGQQRQAAICSARSIAAVASMPSVCGAVQAGLKHENGRKVARSASLQRVASAEHPAKKGCHGRTNKPEQAVKPEHVEAV